MTHLDDHVARLAKRAAIMNVGLANGGPKELLETLLPPVRESIIRVLAAVEVTEQPTFAAVDRPLGDAMADVLAEASDPTLRLRVSAEGVLVAYQTYLDTDDLDALRDALTRLQEALDAHR